MEASLHTRNPRVLVLLTCHSSAQRLPVVGHGGGERPSGLQKLVQLAEWGARPRSGRLQGSCCSFYCSRLLNSASRRKRHLWKSQAKLPPQRKTLQFLGLSNPDACAAKG